MKKLIATILIEYLIILIAGYLFFAFCAWDIEIYKVIPKWTDVGRATFAIVVLIILYTVAETEIIEYLKTKK